METGEIIKVLREEAARSEREAETIARVRGLEGGAMEREEEARRLRDEAEDLKLKARLEDLSVYAVEKVKPTMKGETTYKYWYASWWEGDHLA